VRWFEVDSFEVLELKHRLLQNAPKELELYASKRVAEVKLIGLNLMKSFGRVALTPGRCQFGYIGLHRLSSSEP
jgi:hypothetical protein